MTKDKILDQIDSDFYWEAEGRKWRATQDVPSDAEWFAEIPEIKTVLREKLFEWSNQEKELTEELKLRLLYIQRIDSDLGRYLSRELLKHSLLKEILVTRKRQKRILYQLSQLKPRRKSQSHLTQEEIARARSYPLVELVGTYIDLRRTGQNYCGLCPFHEEKHPSFIIFTKSNTFKCFGCQEGGDVIKFFQLINNTDFVESVKELNRR